MADQSIEIDIIANFKDNATSKVKALNAELDKLENRHIEISVDVADNASSAVGDIGSKLSSLDNFERTTERINKQLSKVDGSMSVFDQTYGRIENMSRTGFKARLALDAAPAEKALVSFANKAKMAILEPDMIPMSYSAGYLPSAKDIAYNPQMLNSANIPYLNSAQKAKMSVSEPILLGAGDYRVLDETILPPLLEPADFNASSDSFSSKWHNYGNDPSEYIAEMEELKAKADEYGIKYKASAGLDEMRSAVWDYEDKNIFSNDSEPLKDNTKALEQVSEGNDKYIQGMKNFGKSLATRMLGAQQVYSGIQNSIGDFTDAFGEENILDRDRLMARGATKTGLMAAGGAIGMLFGNPLLGAGAGALIGDLFGDEIGDMISGIHKSAEELKQLRLDKIFGDIAMSAQDIGLVAQNMLGREGSLQTQYHQQSIQSGYSMQNDVSSNYYGIEQTSGMLAIQSNLGMHLKEGDISAYKSQIKGYTDDISELIIQEMYNSFMNNDDLYGYGNWDASAVSDKYRGLYNDYIQQNKELDKYWKSANKDGNLTYDELEHIFGSISTMYQSVKEATPEESQMKTDTYAFLSQNGMLSKNSYDALQQSLWGDYDNYIQTRGESMQRSIFDGMDTGTAQQAFWNDTMSQLGKAADLSLQSLEGLFSNEITMGRQSYMPAMQDMLNGGLHYQSIIANTPAEWLGEKLKTDNFFDRTFGTGIFQSEHVGEAQILKSEYETLSPQIQRMEKSMVQAMAQGADVSPYVSSLLGFYEKGAMGGDFGAEQKFMAGMFAGNDTLRNTINSAMQTEAGRNSFSEEFRQAWDLFTGGSNADAINKAGEAEKDAFEKTAEKTAQAAKDGAETKKDAYEEATEKTEDFMKRDNSDKELMWDKGDLSGENTKEQQSEQAQQLSENLLNAVNESLSNIDGSTFKDIGLGETLMNSIGESISTDNIDFSELGFGESLLGAIGESLSVDNMDFSELGFGETLMNAISTSLSGDNIDFSQLSIGETLMSGLSASLEGLDMSTLDIGSKILESISGSMEGLDLSSITDSITGQLGDLQCDVNANANVTVVAGNIDTSGVSEAISNALSEFAAEATASATVDIEGTANYTLGSYPTSAPTISGTANYTGVFPTSAPTLYGTVYYSAVFGSFATGTNYAPGGMAMVNDDGSADPRELIEHNGKYMMYDGRDVMTWLYPGDRVYTSAQTKSILSGEGVPHYAMGRRNQMIDTSRKNISDGIIGSGKGLSVNMGDIKMSFNINGDGNIVDEIAAHSEEIGETVSDILADRLSDVFANSSAKQR